MFLKNFDVLKKSSTLPCHCFKFCHSILFSTKSPFIFIFSSLLLYNYSACTQLSALSIVPTILFSSPFCCIVCIAKVISIYFLRLSCGFVVCAIISPFLLLMLIISIFSLIVSTAQLGLLLKSKNSRILFWKVLLALVYSQK